MAKGTRRTLGTSIFLDILRSLEEEHEEMRSSSKVGPVSHQKAVEARYVPYKLLAEAQTLVIGNMLASWNTIDA